MSIEKSRTVFVGRIVTVNVETVRLPNGHVTDLDIIHHPGGAAIVAIDSAGRVCLIRQYRHAVGGWPQEAPERSAQRELLEEAGTTAHSWISLGPYVSSPGVFTEIVHLYLAQDLQSANMSHEAGELIEVHWIDLEKACQRALDADINDGKTALGLLRARSFLQRGVL
jgi:8-oxo-dGTP pyrophosphatase MutT (NUDIX family)